MPILTLPRLAASWLSLLILAAAAYLLWSWGQGYVVRDAAGDYIRLREDWRLHTGLGLLAWSFLGRFVVLLFMRGKPGEPTDERGEAHDVPAPDGSTLRTDSYGPDGGPVLILTHGWGLNATVWRRTVAGLGARFRLIAWDLPGIGRSARPKDGVYSIDRFAQDLGAVVESSGADKVVLVGHSIGGMTTQTLWRACPAAVRRKVTGIVLVNTTYLDPLQTMWGRELWRALKTPLIVPLNRLAIRFSPLLWLMNWQSYLSGSSQLAMRLAGFGRYASRGEVDFAARLISKASPAVQARGNLAMLAWSAAEVLPSIDVPVLILAGERDIVTLPEASDQMASRLPQAQVIRVEGVGHMGFMERAEVYNQAIADFAEAAFRRADKAEGADGLDRAMGHPDAASSRSAPLLH